MGCIMGYIMRGFTWAGVEGQDVVRVYIIGCIKEYIMGCILGYTMMIGM